MKAAEQCDCAGQADLLQVEVKRLSYGPFAVAYDNGQVVFVAGGAPGDRISARITRRHRRYLEAELVHRCHPGPSYRVPPCPFQRNCGGCPWQHVREKDQITSKVSIARETLRRIGGIELEGEILVKSSPITWAYRNRIRLHVGTDRAVGFKALRSDKLTEIAYCMVADPAINAELAKARALVKNLALRLREVELVAAGSGRVVFIAVAAANQAFTPEDRGTMARFLTDHPGVAGIVLRKGKRSHDLGDTSMAWEDKRCQQPATAFSQVNWTANELLREAVLEAARPSGDDRILELYCGAGNFSLSLAKRAASLLGVDASKEAVAAARGNARNQGLSNVKFKVNDAARELKSSRRSFDIVILDPPRPGAAHAIEGIIRKAIPKVVYVSCNPATLARDAATLAQAGYKISNVTGVDLFPQTYHFEVVLTALRQG